MKHLFFGSVALLALVAGGPAGAAVMPVKAPVYKAPVAAPVPIFNWTGVYVGGQGGYAWGRVGYELFDFSQAWFMKPKGAFGGGHLGYNWQSGPWVFGAETDINGGSIDDGFVTSSGVIFSSKVDWFGSARVRIGYAQDRWMAYATGGYAFGHFEHVNDARGAFGGNTGILRPAAHDEVRHGWTVGGGLEYAVWDNWTVRAEYRFTDYGEKSYPEFDIGGGTTNIAHHVDLTMQQVLLGITYKFGWSGPVGKGPVVTRY